MSTGASTDAAGGLQLRHLTAADFRRMPWANGRGVTSELLRREDAAGRLVARLSVADVVEAGPFSPLPGIDRVITLIEGAGFALDFAGAAPPVTLRPFEPVAFSGDWPTSAVDVKGPSRDFNVMTARGTAAASVTLRRGAGRLDVDGECLVYAPAGPGRIAGTGLAAGELVQLVGRGSVEIDSAAPLIVVALSMV